MKDIKKNLSYYKIGKNSKDKCIGGVGVACFCGCHYSGLGGATTHENNMANWAMGLKSPLEPIEY